MDDKLRIIDPSVIIGEGTIINSYVEIRAKTVIGANCYIDSYCCFTGESKIGDNVTIRNRCTIARGVEIGDHTFLAPHCMFQNLDSGKKKVGGAKIGKNCFIGTAVVFKEGIKICDGVTIGSMSYVNKDITEPGIYIGSPAKKIR